MSTEQKQINELIASGATSGSISTGGTWGDAPKITTNQKVTAPSKIKASHDGDEVIEIAPVKGPTLESLNAASKRDAARRLQEFEEAEAKAQAIEECSPEKVQARLAFLERTVGKLTKQLNQLKNSTNDA